MSLKSSSAGHVSIDVILISTVETFSNLTVTFSPPTDPSTVIVYVYVLPTGTSCGVVVVVEVVILIGDNSLNARNFAKKLPRIKDHLGLSCHFLIEMLCTHKHNKPLVI